MFSTNDQFSKASLSGFEAALRVAQISLDSAERLVKLNLEASKQTLEENVKIAKALAESSDPQQA